MSNKGNMKMMRQRVEALTREDVNELVMDIVQALYPEGNMEHEWSPNTLEEISGAVHAHHIPPWVATGWAK